MDLSYSRAADNKQKIHGLASKITVSQLYMPRLKTSQRASTKHRLYSISSMFEFEAPKPWSNAIQVLKKSQNFHVLPKGFLWFLTAVIEITIKSTKYNKATITSETPLLGIV
jgi:hypothetical protein